jgi:hypothetical protein
MYTEKFQLNTAEEWAVQTKYKHVIFLCDLRTGHGRIDDKIRADIKLQQQLTVLINASRV